MGDSKTGPDHLTALVADQDGNIFEVEGYAAVGMADTEFVTLTPENTLDVPFGGELMYLPDRRPVLYNLERREFETLAENPYRPGEVIYPVACFNSPGYVNTHVSGYRENRRAGELPLFSYGAVGWFQGNFRSALILVDSENRQDLRFMKKSRVMDGIRKKRKQLPSNRLRAHLEKCALVYSCPAGKNFFLERYEAPLPTSKACNARCLGCISLQENTGIPSSQNRIDFIPSPDEIAGVAVNHIQCVSKSVVSFGQGCEGDPLMAAHVIEPAIRNIRASTGRGTINLNTNGSRPDILEKLIHAGLDSVRISLNSVRNDYYTRYFRPMGYAFSDVIKSIDLALEQGVFVSINYLNCPGFTDSPGEFKALVDFLNVHAIHMIQWRNLNHDPVRYWKKMLGNGKRGKPMGMSRLVQDIRKRFPNLNHGYFNPPKETRTHGVISEKRKI